MPTSYPQYTPTGPVVDGQLTQELRRTPPSNDAVTACGDFAVNTIQPAQRRRTAAGAAGCR